jgi:hypothetical protein
MTHFKIIETGHEIPDVLLHRDRDEDGNEIVKIFAVGIIDGSENMFAGEEISFENAFTASEYIEAFTKKNAENWCKRQEVVYW